LVRNRRLRLGTTDQKETTMDSRGHMYSSEELAKQLQATSPTKIRPLKGMVGRPRVVAIQDSEIAKALASMNRAARQVFFGARKNGDPERVALAKAVARSKGK
jgi:hypothetical protein